MTDNTMFPGRPDYTGPTKGPFGLLHHSEQQSLCESSDNVMERVEYVRHNKPASEVDVRLYNMIYLGGCDAAAQCATLFADYKAKRAALYADYGAKWDALFADYRAKWNALFADYKAKRAALYADYEAKWDALFADYEAKSAPLYAEILAYIRLHIPDCAWDEQKCKLVFP